MTSPKVTPGSARRQLGDKSFPARAVAFEAAAAAWGSDVILLLQRQVLASQHKDWEVGRSRMGAPFPRAVEKPLTPWQNEVENYELRHGGRNACAGFRSIGRGGREVAVLGEQFGDELPGWSVVFDNQDGPWLSDSLALVHASLQLPPAAWLYSRA